MYKNPVTGFYEHDFRVKGIDRYHLSYGTGKKADAVRLHGTAVALFKSKEIRVIDAMRGGGVSIEQLTQFRETGRPFASVLDQVQVEEPWPLWPDAVEQYLTAIANSVRKAGTGRVATQELKRFTRFMTDRLGTADVRLDQIFSMLIDDYQAALNAADYKPNTVSAYCSRIGSVFHWFIRYELRTSREAKRQPRVLHVPIDPETISRTKTARVRALSTEEGERVLAATPAPFLFPVAAGLFGGFRIDEVCHFRTAHDVDLELGVLSVQRQPRWSPKTKRSLRHVPIAKALRPILERHLERYASEDWVVPGFRNPTKPLNSNLFARHVTRIVEDADLIAGITDPDGVTYHTFRHTFASWSLMGGTDVFTVAKLLGNTVKQVEDTYGHLALDFRQAAVDLVADRVKLPSLHDGEITATENATTEPDFGAIQEGE